MLIAQRSLKISDAGCDVEVPIRLFKPEEDDGTWMCRYEIDWPDRTRSMAGAGFDSIQALIIALQMIGAEIYTSDYHRSGSLSWDEASKGYGFPVGRVLRDLLVGDDAIFF